MENQVESAARRRNRGAPEAQIDEVGRHVLNLATLYGSDIKRQFKRRQLVIVPQAIPLDVCDAVLRSVRSTKFIVVDNPQDREVTRFYTKNGDSLIAVCPEVLEIERGLLDWINAIGDQDYVALDNRSIGVSLNVTPPGGGFGTHPDRNEITIILFLNDLGSGALHVYRPFPRLLGYALRARVQAHRARALRRRMIKFLNSSQNAIAQIAHRLLFHPVGIIPKAGTVVAFTRLSDHRVDPVQPGSLRFSLVLGFDRPGISFKEGQKYYGYAHEELVLGDSLPT